MLNIIGKKNWYFAISILTIVPGIIALFLWGLNLSIDFTGGSRVTFLFPQQVNEQKVNEVKNIFAKENIDIVTTQTSDNRVIIRTKPLDETTDAKLVASLQKEVPEVKRESFETIGPVIGREITLNALKAMGVASLLIVLYIAWAFRHVPKPVSSWRFGICTIIALLHDALLVIGLFSILGHFFHVEVDNLFVTALLTVAGFSVHDTIVVFDRIRENLRRTAGLPFAQVVNDSILQTLVRSLNTSLTTILVLFTLLLFGGESIRWFIVALLVGIISGTYSSIFNAAPLLVLWDELDAKRRTKKK